MEKTQIDVTPEEVEALKRFRARAVKKNEPKLKRDKYPKSGYRKDPENLHMYVNDVRILTPREYKALKAAIPTDEHKTDLDILLITGMRYAEYLRLYENHEWYNEKKNLIHLDEFAQLKHKRSQKERTIHPLPYGFSYLMKAFWNGHKPPLEATWNQNMQRWAKKAGLNPFGMSVKTTRKTIESWQISAGINESTVCLRAGHDSVTSLQHYQGLAFSDDEQRDIKNQLNEWAILKK